MNDQISVLKQQLRQLGELRESGVLTPEQYEESKARVERQLLDLVLADDGAGGTETVGHQAAPGEPAGEVSGEVSGESPEPMAAALPEAGDDGSSAAQTPAPGLSWRHGVAGAAFVLVIAAGGYWWTRAPQPLDAGAAAPASQASANDSEKIDAMVNRLAARLKDNPTDAVGWATLARTYAVVGRSAEAVDAYVKAVELVKNDAALLADYADALAVKNNRNLSGEAIKVVESALKIDPRNVKALALAGTHAFDTKDYRKAVKYWEQAVEIGGPDNPFAKQIAAGLAQARETTGLKAPASPTPAPAASTAGVSVKSAASATVGVSGSVTIATSIASKVQAEDTVFITARSETGSRMPLAVMRKQVKDLPLSFRLDDSLAMSADSKISGAGKVIVTARVSKGGNAMPQPGDYVVHSAPVAVGATGLALEIREPIKP